MVQSRLEKGFTLIELITVIIVLGVVSVGISGFIRTGVDIYTDVTERDQLLGESRFVIERLTRELRMAVPNSVRVKNDSTTHCIQFVPTQWVSFYTNLSVFPDTTTSATIVEFADNPVGFELLAGDFAIVYPTNSNDVYDLGNNKRKVISSCSDNGTDTGCGGNVDDPNRTATLTVTGAFADHSPASRLYIARKTVSYCANSAREIYRVEDNITETQEVYASGTLMAQNMNNVLTDVNEAPFTVFEATLTRNSLVHILLNFELNEEIVNYSNEIHFPNAP
jgi:MSHA biogenesis protein MshO